MQILSSNNSLNQYLIAQSSKNIRVVTAFAGGTEAVLGKLIAQKNEVELLLGTINAFTSPKVIEYCKSKSSSKFRTFVDFRLQNSIHWKLYLISPMTVIVGSANFTETGLSLQRDTCVVIEDLALYKQYSKLIDDLLKAPEVILAEDAEDFNKRLEAYRQMHNRVQSGMARTKTSISLKQWLSDETNQQVPLLIWDTNHTAETRAEASELLENSLAPEESTPILRDFFVWPAPKGKLPYNQGDVVLCSGKRGGHLGFFVFDRIIYNRGKHYIFSYRETKYTAPFAVEPIRKSIKPIIQELYSNGGATYLDRDALKALAL